MYNIEKTFGENLRQLRTGFKMTQDELGNKVGYSGKSVSKWECGEAVPGAQTLVKIADLLGTDLNFLLGYHTKPSYFLGIDGGATKTAFALADENGKIIRNYKSGPCNPVDVGVNRMQQVMEEGICEICAKIPLGSVSVFAGIAGGITGANKRIIAAFLGRFKFSKSQNDSDMANALAVGLHGKNGIASVIGTGCITYAAVNGKNHRVGGYGYLFDEGISGYGLGCDAIRAALRANDGSGEKTVLSDMVEQKSGQKPLEHLGDYYSGGKGYIASFAPLVFDAYAQGDGVAEKIVKNGVKNLAKNLAAAETYFTGEITPVPAVLVGGLSACVDVILPLIKGEMNKSRIDLQICREEPVKGALLLAGVPNTDSEETFQ